MASDNLIDGRAIADQIHEETRRHAEALKAHGTPPGLVFVRVGEDPASRVYVGMKEKACDRLGIQSQTRILPEDTTEKDLLKLIGELNADPTLHGILVQAPLPSQINEANIFAAVSANKDVGTAAVFADVGTAGMAKGDCGVSVFGFLAKDCGHGFADDVAAAEDHDLGAAGVDAAADD